jgi:hypothetical protein
MFKWASTKPKGTSGTMPRRAVTEKRISDGQLLTGHVAEWGELRASLAEQIGLTVLVADPLSGASLLLQAALKESADKHVLVDARMCGDTRDLAMAIADAAIGAMAPEALGWWQGSAPPSSTAGLRLRRRLHESGIETEQLQSGKGDGAVLLRRALELTMELAAGYVPIAVDHLGVMLSNIRASAAREILDAFRTAGQREGRIGLVLVDQPHGPITGALGDPDHPLYRAGQRLRVTRPTADRVSQDVAITKPMLRTPIGLLRVAADLATGVPSLMWEIVAQAGEEGDVAARAMEGWQRIRRANATSVRQQWDELRRLHPAAQALVAAISLGIRPHGIQAASKTVDDGLNRLRDVGVAWQPEDRTWAIADPLLAAYAREHAPPWAQRRRAGARIRASRGPTDSLVA